MDDFDPEEAVAVLERTPDVLRTWLGALPEAWIDVHEEGAGWSPREIVGHLVHGEETDWMPRLRQILAGEGDRPFEPFDRYAMLGGTVRPIGELLDELAALRRANLDELRGLSLSPGDLARQGLHPELGPVTLGELLATWVVHDLTHIAQIARVTAKRYRGAVGPWRAYNPLLDR